MPNNTYNGWANKETWLVNLWLGDILTSDKEEGFEITPEYVEEFVESFIENPLNGLIADLLNCALGSINYREIAEFYKS